MAFNIAVILFNVGLITVALTSGGTSVYQTVIVIAGCTAILFSSLAIIKHREE